jgi:putrescine aminotransferase
MKINSDDLDSDLFERYGQLINPAHPNFLKRLGIHRIAVRAKGVVITDSGGRQYIDCIGGYGLFNVGHNHPKMTEALIEQLRRADLLTKPFIIELQIRIAEKLKKITPEGLDCTYLCCGGSEAIDNALKLSRLHTGNSEIISAENAFHGYTFGALSASGIPSFKRSFEPLVPGMIHVPYGDIVSLKKVVSSDTAAILLEPVQHETGVNVPQDTYLKQVSEICESQGIILIFDEIMTGFGKTGRMFACDHFRVVPDILVFGKAAGGGLVPSGGLIAKKKLWRKFGLSFPMSATSFAWNALTCQALLTTINILKEEKLILNSRKNGAYLLNGLKSVFRDKDTIVREVQGVGLMISIECITPAIAFKLTKKMLDRNILIGTAWGNTRVLMVEPPLVISREQIETVIKEFGDAVESM